MQQTEKVALKSFRHSGFIFLYILVRSVLVIFYTFFFPTTDFNT